MKLLFKQRFFSWFDSYDIYDENGDTVFVVHGRPSWGHRLEISDAAGNYVGTVKQAVFTLMPRFELWLGENCVGALQKEFTFFKPRYTLDFSGWSVEGDFMGWDYNVVDAGGELVMQASKELFQLTDTYVMDIVRPEDALVCLMTVLAIDAEKCSDG